MTPERAYLLDPGGAGGASVAPLASAAEAARLALRQFPALPLLVEQLKLDRERGTEAVAVMIGPNVGEPLACARHIRAGWQGHLLFVPAATGLPPLRRQLAVAPMIGDNWALCEVGDPRLPQVVAQSAKASMQRRQLRTTLDRANLRLSARDAVDASRYRAFFLSDRYLATIVRQASYPIISLDADDVVTGWNRGAEEAFRLRPAQAIGLRAHSLPAWPAPLIEALHEARATDQSVSAELVVPAPGGDRHFHASVSSVRDDAGRYMGASVVLHDVSFAARALAAEQAARVQAEQMSRMKDEFLATLSHELRTPLSAVLSWTQLLQMKGGAEYREGLDAIQRNARMQAQLIDDLLDVSRIVTGQPFLDVQPVSVVEIAERAIAVVAPAAAAKRIAVGTTYEENLPAVQGDPKRLQQVLWNLLANAVKFTPDGGRIGMCVRLARSAVEVIVSDNGKGIEAQFLPHLFERFRQGDASSRRAHGGLGLGLAIVKQLVELHGGTVGGTSEGAGRGAVFTIRLPVLAMLGQARDAIPSRERGVEAPTQPMPPAAALRGTRVLVVEDEADSRGAVERILRHWGADTASAGSVEEALALVARFRPSVLVSDIGMPGRDGHDLVRTLRKNGWSRDALPAVALTAYVRQEDAEHALASGFQAHVPKPTDAVRLVNVVYELARIRNGA
jgi:signal transduction histidine kinase